MEDPIITVKNIGKKYTIAHQTGGYIALRDVIMNVLKSPFSFIAKKAKQVTGFEKNEDFWALKNVNFEVKRGEIIGIIGKNGAGKSTLLKVLSQITPPTTGQITIHGRVGSLLEVGTGFHPELTGRENIFLNGAILGMKRKEIVKKFDQIVEFSGIAKFLDTPVKYYSSGMYVRLAFSVAAHMEPDILIVDEVLAVGDSEFQKKCLGKMNEITTTEGRTVIFVSHNMDAIKQLCHTCVFLEQGQVKAVGKTDDIIDMYLDLHKASLNPIIEPIATDNSPKQAEISRISILNSDHRPSAEIRYDEPFQIDIEYKINSNTEGALLCLFIIRDGQFYLISSEADAEQTSAINIKHEKGSYKTTIAIDPFIVRPGHYTMEISIQRPFQEYIQRVNNIALSILETTEPKNNLWKQVPVQASPVLRYHTKKYD